jgi:hypothetical protein
MTVAVPRVNSDLSDPNPNALGFCEMGSNTGFGFVNIMIVMQRV